MVFVVREHVVLLGVVLKYSLMEYFYVQQLRILNYFNNMNQF